jgi:hypothetical protein
MDASIIKMSRGVAAPLYSFLPLIGLEVGESSSSSTDDAVAVRATLLVVVVVMVVVVVVVVVVVGVIADMLVSVLVLVGAVAAMVVVVKSVVAVVIAEAVVVVVVPLLLLKGGDSAVCSFSSPNRAPNCKSGTTALASPISLASLALLASLISPVCWRSSAVCSFVSPSKAPISNKGTTTGARTERTFSLVPSKRSRVLVKGSATRSTLANAKGGTIVFVGVKAARRRSSSSNSSRVRHTSTAGISPASFTAAMSAVYATPPVSGASALLESILALMSPAQIRTSASNAAPAGHCIGKTSAAESHVPGTRPNPACVVPLAWLMAYALGGAPLRSGNSASPGANNANIRYRITIGILGYRIKSA